MSELKPCPTSEGAELDAAVDEFAAAMKKRLRSKLKQGWHGWESIHPYALEARLLRNIVKATTKQDKKSMIDTANLSMMLWRNTK